MKTKFQKTFLAFAFLFVANFALAQAPQGIPYQAVARDNAGNLIKNQPIALRFSIHDGTASGAVVYSETHSVTTDALGLFAVNVGGGTSSGTLANVNWGSGAKFTQVELDVTGNDNYTDMGTTQMMSVPYALYAGSSGNSSSVSMGAIGQTSSGNGATITNGVLSLTPADPTNGGIVTTEAQTIAGNKNLTGNTKLSNMQLANGTQAAGSYLTSDANGNASWSSTISINTLGITPNMSSPTLINTVPTGNFPNAIAISGNYAYVANADSNNMSVFNISNPSAPALVSTVATGNNPNAIATSGNYVYVTNIDSNTMSVFNVSTPNAPSLVSTVATGNSPTAIVIFGNYAYVTSRMSNNMSVFNISIPSAPSLVSTVATGNHPSAIVISGNYAYITNRGSNNMSVYNISIPSAPSLIFTIATANAPRAIATSGNYAYVLDGVYANNISVFNISNPSSPLLINTVSTREYSRAIAIFGSYLCVLNTSNMGNNMLDPENNMLAYDISTPSSPTLRSTLATGILPNAITCSGTYAYITNGNSNDMSVIKTSSRGVLTSNGSGGFTWDNTNNACSYSIGQYAPALGGFIFYLDGTGCHGLVCAPTDQNEGVGDLFFTSPNAVNLVDSGIGLGKGNTQYLIKKFLGPTYAECAAGKCTTYNGGGFKDWYLPSRYELILMWLTVGQGAANVGGFASDVYWNSTDSEFTLNFSTGDQHQSSFGGERHRVRAVRVF